MLFWVSKSPNLLTTLICYKIFADLSTVWYSCLNGSLVEASQRHLLPMFLVSFSQNRFHSTVFPSVVVHRFILRRAQVISNACATQAIVSILLNSHSIDVGEELKSFRSFTLELPPDVRLFIAFDSVTFRVGYVDWWCRCAVSLSPAVNAFASPTTALHVLSTSNSTSRSSPQTMMMRSTLSGKRYYISFLITIIILTVFIRQLYSIPGAALRARRFEARPCLHRYVDA